MAVSSERMACPSFLFLALYTLACAILLIFCAHVCLLLCVCVFLLADLFVLSACLFFLLTAFCLFVFPSFPFFAALPLLFAVLSRLCGLALHFDKCEALGAPAIKQIQIKRHSLFLGYVFFNEQIQGLLGFETMNR